MALDGKIRFQKGLASTAFVLAANLLARLRQHGEDMGTSCWVCNEQQ